VREVPDGPRPKGPDYDDDFYAWTQYQAEVLRTLPTSDNRFDREHLAEEVEDLGKSERDAVRSQVERILLHFLKLRFGWRPLAKWNDIVIAQDNPPVVLTGRRGDYACDANRPLCICSQIFG